MKLVELHQDRFCVLTGAPVHIVHTMIYSTLAACKPEVRFWSHIDYETSENGRPHVDNQARMAGSMRFIISETEIHNLGHHVVSCDLWCPNLRCAPTQCSVKFRRSLGTNVAELSVNCKCCSDG